MFTDFGSQSLAIAECDPVASTSSRNTQAQPAFSSSAISSISTQAYDETVKTEPYDPDDTANLSSLIDNFCSNSPESSFKKKFRRPSTECSTMTPIDEDENKENIAD